MSEKVISVMKRYELKYHLTKEQLSYFQEKISSHLKVDQYGLTSIASIYFDTPTMTLITKSIEKPNFKEKIRLRSYGLAHEHSPVFLEIKRKLEGVVYKRRIVTTEDQVNKFLFKDKEFDKSQISRELYAFKEAYGKLEPKYLIIYDRIAYFEENSDLRITLDINPRYRTNDLNLHTSMNGMPLLKEGEAILEVKVQHSIPLWLSEILKEGKIYKTSFSKVGTAHKLTHVNKVKDIQPELNLIHLRQKERRLQYGFTI